ncbi:MAG: peptidase M42 [Campylobacterales bacterium]|nr:peptidase M42 [Campylobacterales bacterium]
MELFYDILKQLIRIPSVVGAEHPFLMFLKRDLEELGLDVEYYDGVLVAKGKNPQSGYISAHVDRHGLICTGHNEFQYAAFIAKNQADLQGTSNSEQILKNFVYRFVDQKVQAYQPYSGSYLGIGEIKDAFLCERRNNIIFKVEGFDYLLPSTPIAFMDKLSIENDLVSAQLDNVLSVAIILYLYHLGYQGTAFFTASEEAGKSWRFLLEWFRRFDLTTDQLLVLDTSPYESLEDIANLDIVLRNRDENGYFRSPLKAIIKKIVLEKGIKYHFKDAYLKNKMRQLGITEGSIGVTELGRLIHATKGTIQGTTLQVPTIGYHTVNESTFKKSIDAMIEVLKTLYDLKPTQ